VSDDGDGIPKHIIRNYTQQTNAPIDDLPAEAHPKPTLGLLSVTERARLIKGSINISDNSPSGTVVCLTLH
jgi:two-component system sensor histidine kinase UhpB